jgi:hypothetical protein
VAGAAARSRPLAPATVDAAGTIANHESLITNHDR